MSANEIEPFASCIVDAKLVELQTGGIYSWSNNNKGYRRKWSRIDRVFINNSWLDSSPPLLIKLMVQGASDHSPLFFYWTNNEFLVKPFRFTNS